MRLNELQMKHKALFCLFACSVLALALLILLFVQKRTIVYTTQPKQISYSKVLQIGEGHSTTPQKIEVSKTALKGTWGDEDIENKWEYFYDSQMSEGCRDIYLNGSFQEYERKGCLKEERDHFGDTLIDDIEWLCKTIVSQEKDKDIIRKNCSDDLWQNRADVIDFVKNNYPKITQFTTQMFVLAFSRSDIGSGMISELIGRYIGFARRPFVAMYVLKLIPKIKEGYRVDGILLDELENREKKLNELKNENVESIKNGN